MKLFFRQSFSNGDYTTVVRGRKWRTKFPLSREIEMINSVTGEHIGNALFLGGIQLEFKLLKDKTTKHNRFFKLHHDPRCKSYLGLAQVMAYDHKNFSDTEIVSVIYFRV